MPTRKPTKPKKKITVVPKRRVLVPKQVTDKRGVAERVRTGGLGVREQEAKIREKLAGLTDKRDELENAIKNINAASAVLSDMFASRNVSMRSLAGARIDANVSNTEVRNKIIRYIGKLKNLRVVNMPNASDVRTLLKAITSARRYGYESRALLQDLAELKSQIDKLDADLRHIQRNGMTTVLRQRVVKPGASPLEAFRNVQEKAAPDLKQLRDVEDRVNGFLKELMKVKTLRALTERGIDVTKVEKQVAEVRSRLSALETSYQEDSAEQKKYQSKNALALKRNDTWAARQEQKAREKFASNKKKLADELEKIKLAAKARLDLRQGELGLSGIYDRSNKISQTQTAIDSLKAQLAKLMLQTESFSVDLGDKSFEQREAELRNYIEQGKFVRKIKKNAPGIKGLQEVKQSSAWEAAVRDAVRSSSKARTFPSIAANALSILSKRGSNLDISPKFPDAVDDVKTVISYGIDGAQKWFYTNFDTLAVNLGTLSIMSSMNISGMKAIKGIDAIIAEYFNKVREHINTPDAQSHVEKLISISMLKAKKRGRGVGIDVSSKVYVKRRASSIINMVRSPSYTALNGLRSKTALAVRQQLNDWVSRNVRFEED